MNEEVCVIGVLRRYLRGDPSQLLERVPAVSILARGPLYHHHRRETNGVTRFGGKVCQYSTKNTRSGQDKAGIL